MVEARNSNLGEILIAETEVVVYYNSKTSLEVCLLGSYSDSPGPAEDQVYLSTPAPLRELRRVIRNSDGWGKGFNSDLTSTRWVVLCHYSIATFPAF